MKKMIIVTLSIVSMFTYYGYKSQVVAEQEASVKTFVREYVKLTKNEDAMTFYTVNKQYAFSKAQLSDYKWEAIFMSTGLEAELNRQRFMESSERAVYLSNANLGIKFVIDEINIVNVPDSSDKVAVVRGKYVAKSYKKDLIVNPLPEHLTGYKEFKYIIEESSLSRLTKEEVKDKDAKKELMVVYSEERDVSASELLMNIQDKLIENI